VDLASSQVDNDMEFLRELITDFMIDFDSKKELNSEHLKQLAKDQKAVEVCLAQ